MLGTVYTDEELVELTRTRGARSSGGRLDSPYLEQLLLRYEERIARWCLQVLHQRDDAADCAQEVLLRVCKGLSNFRGGSSFATWVYAVTRSACFDLLARRQAQARREASLAEVEVETIPASPDRPDTHAADRESRMLFRAAFERHTSPEESRAMELHHVDGYSMKKVTQLLGLGNASGSRAFLASAKRKLRQHLSLHVLSELGFEVQARRAEGATHGR